MSGMHFEYKKGELKMKNKTKDEQIEDLNIRLEVHKQLIDEKTDKILRLEAQVKTFEMIMDKWLDKIGRK